MRSAARVACAKARDGDVQPLIGGKLAAPDALTAGRTHGNPGFVQGRRGSQIVYVPVQMRLGVAQMVRETCAQTTGTERAAHVEIKSWCEPKTTKSPDGHRCNRRHNFQVKNIAADHRKIEAF